MDPTQRSSGALLDRASADIAQLLRRFENLVALAPVDLNDPNSTAVVAYQIKVETAALVRSAENLLTLTRILKESWLFGKLQTLGGSEAERRAEESAVAVGKTLTRLGILSGGEEEQPFGPV